MGQRRVLCDCTAKRHMRYFCCTEARKLQATGGHWPSCSLTTETMPSDPEIGTVHDIVEAMQSRSGVDLLVDELHCQIHSSEPVIPHRTDRTFVGLMAGDDICGALSPIVTPYNSHWDSSSDNVDAIPYINDIPFDDSAYAAVWAEAQAIRSRNE